MKLSDRLKRTDLTPVVSTGAATATTVDQPAPAQPAGAVTTDPLVRMKQRAQEALFSKLGARLYDPSLSADELTRFVG